jgi:Glycosyl transferase family 2
MAWMFPLLAVVSLMMNGSVHFRRSRGVSEIEKGPPATSVPMEGQSPFQSLESQPAQHKSKLIELIRKQIEEPTTTKSTLTQALSRTKEFKTTKQVKLPPQEKPPGSSVDKERKLDTANKLPRQSNLQLADDAAIVAKLGADAAAPIPSKKKKKKTKKKTVALPFKIKSTVPRTGAAHKTATSTKVDPAVADAVVPTRTRVKVSPAALSPDVTFSACLLVRDDNDIINEWIAYHYHVLRMRRLIVAVDPNSETSPSDVLVAWSKLINITLWTDEHYMPKDFLETGKAPMTEMKDITKFGEISESENIAINNHRYRQRVFLGKCLKKVKEERRTWAVHIDTDEYIVPSKHTKRFTCCTFRLR